MKENKDKFEVKEIFKRKFKNMPELKEVLESNPVNLVRSGKTGEGMSIPIEVKELIDKSCKDIVGEDLGYSSYEELREKLNSALTF
eukprot:snap_masked-scaffold_3-processed-gene-2.35-mRNA-1 protein AED:1.00 eAED:1.00 QI:0/-1/0/0/-1/1/1/0/85